jgi:UDPglucose 6-dehydrogenase
MLLREGCEIRACDPAAMERARAVLPQEGISYVASPYDAAQDADALLILTDWKEFAELDLERLRATLAYPIVVDGRNLYNPATMSAAGFIYCSIGRADALADGPAPAEPGSKFHGEGAAFTPASEAGPSIAEKAF